MDAYVQALTGPPPGASNEGAAAAVPPIAQGDDAKEKDAEAVSEPIPDAEAVVEEQFPRESHFPMFRLTDLQLDSIRKLPDRDWERVLEHATERVSFAYFKWFCIAIKSFFTLLPESEVLTEPATYSWAIQARPFSKKEFLQATLFRFT